MRLTVLLALIVLGSACAPGMRTFDPTDEFALAREFNGRSVIVGLDDGRAVRAQAVRMDPDSSSWVNVDTGEFEVVPTTTVVRVARQETTGEGILRGARQGAIVGAVAGGLVYSLIGIQFGGANTAETFAFVALGVVGGAGSGAFWGGAIGALAPDTRRYEPTPQDLSDARATGPLRSPRAEPLDLRASDPLNLRGTP